MQNKHHVMHSKYYKVKCGGKNFIVSTISDINNVSGTMTLTWTINNAFIFVSRLLLEFIP